MDTYGVVKLIRVTGNMRHLKTYKIFESVEDKKIELRNKIDSLPDTYHYLTHVTSPEVAKKIFETQFVYNLGTGLSGTCGQTNKESLYQLLSNMIDGISPHRGQLGCFLLAFPKSEFGQLSSERRVNIDTIENDLIDNYPEMSGGKIPTKFNYGYFADGKLITKDDTTISRN